MTQPERPDGEIAILGLGKSGSAAAKLLLADAKRVYISDAGSALSLGDTARQLSDLGAATDVGAHDIARIRRSAKLVVSPGIPPTAEPIVAARQARVPIVSEIEIALPYLSESRIIAVTGTNGKTTTTSLIGHVLRGLGETAVDAGNIGTPLSDVARRDSRPDWIALEMSSFQLHDTPGLRPHVGVLTNLMPDHLDRYLSVDEYYADKQRLFANASDSSRWVVNADDPRVRERTAEVKGRRYLFSLLENADAWLDDTSGTLHVLGSELMKRSELSLLGNHNVANALAATLAVFAADEKFTTKESRAAAADALRNFNALSHRLEIVGEKDGVQWINDSKATNVSSTLVAVDGMRRPTILLLGGRHKGEPYTALAEPVRKIVKRIIAYGEAASEIEKDLDEVVPVETLGSDFDEVIATARKYAEPGDVVLMSPACSSYDMFRNYEERGERFRQLSMTG
jgi:UDP-N-acetylmuramoylalanine--D-glutamate ligase